MLMLFKKENKPAQDYLVFGLPVRGGHAIYLPKYKEEETVFLLTLVGLGCQNYVKAWGGADLPYHYKISKLGAKPFFSKFAIVCITSK